MALRLDLSPGRRRFVRLLPVLVAVGGVVLSLGGWSLVRREADLSCLRMSSIMRAAGAVV